MRVAVLHGPACHRGIRATAAGTVVNHVEEGAIVAPDHAVHLKSHSIYTSNKFVNMAVLLNQPFNRKPTSGL